MSAVSGISGAMLSGLTPVADRGTAAGPAIGTGFGDAVKSALQNVSDAEREAESIAVAIATGEDRSVSDLMVAASKATLSVELMSQIRNRAVEAYQEIMRMQV